jgi:hypothetical protein
MEPPFDIMKLNHILFLILVGVLLACSRREQFASSAVATDFDGSWGGSWEWVEGKNTSISLSGNRISASNFPVRTDALGTLVVLSGDGEATFEPAYGDKSAPCVLVSFPQTRHVVALFLTADKKRLVYDVSLSQDWRIVFKKDTSASK